MLTAQFIKESISASCDPDIKRAALNGMGTIGQLVHVRSTLIYPQTGHNRLRFLLGGRQRKQLIHGSGEMTHGSCAHFLEGK